MSEGAQLKQIKKHLNALVRFSYEDFFKQNVEFILEDDRNGYDSDNFSNHAQDVFGISLQNVTTEKIGADFKLNYLPVTWLHQIFDSYGLRCKFTGTLDNKNAYEQIFVDNAKKFETELKLSIDNINKLSADQLNSLVSDLEKKMTFIYLEYAN